MQPKQVDELHDHGFVSHRSCTPSSHAVIKDALIGFVETVAALEEFGHVPNRYALVGVIEDEELPGDFANSEPLCFPIRFQFVFPE
jgi:hypothetical protein